MENSSGKKSKLAFPNASPAYVDLVETWQSRARPVVIWAGAGLSAPANLPSWPTLQNKIYSQALRYVSSLSLEQQKEKDGQLKAIKTLTSAWLAFEKLESILGTSNFEAEIKRELNFALKCVVPPAYSRLWKLGVHGFLTLNIDRLAYRAFSETGTSAPLVERSGFDVKALIGNINSIDRPFIANLHGVFEDPTTWVFTESRRQALMADERYQEFVRDILKYCTVVMLGISAHDVAVKDHLARLKKDGIRGTHIFWVSSESGSEPLEIAEQNGIRFVSYKNLDGSHAELNKFFDDIESFSSPQPDPPPVASENKTVGGPGTLPNLDELLVLAPNIQRELLNDHASRILNVESENSYEKFDTFCKTYNRAIHAAGLLDTEPGSDRILEYTLSNLEDSEGGFGTIWRAYDDEGNQVAIKVFKHEIRKNPSLLKAFRRGVRSLRILSKHQLPGIVEFKTACEIPPVLVMEWIEGANLFEAVNQGKLRDWHVRLRVAYDLVTAIYSAHSVPERVLHRDIKPQNIMFRDFHQDGDQSKLVVLDFDLSWHVGALEKSVLAKGANPYLAPEQLLTQSGMTSRSAAVDVYGFGMTLYFLVTGAVPIPFMHKSAEWPTRLEGIAKQVFKPWRSLPRRISRLIDVCTKHDQNLRPSFSQIAADISHLIQVLNGNLSLLDTASICEEIAARSEFLDNYKIIDNGTVFWRSLTGRLRTTIRPGIRGDDLFIKFEYMQTGGEQFNSLTTAFDQVYKIQQNFPATLIVGKANPTIQHGHYINEIHVAIDPKKLLEQIEMLHLAVSTSMNKLMSVGV